MRNPFAVPLRSKSSPENSIPCLELLSGGPLTYEVDRSFAKWPKAYSGYQVCGTCTDQERLYVTTRCPDCPVAVFSMDGYFIRGLAAHIPKGRVHGIWKDRRGRIIYADDGAHVIRCISEEGKLLNTLGKYMEPSDTGYDASIEGHLSYLSVKRLAGPFNKPTRLVEGGNGCYYASDGYANAAVHQFDENFNLIRSWGGPGTGQGEFSIVHSLVTDCRGRVLVADRDNDRVQLFQENGAYLDSINNLLYPCDVDTDGDFIYIAENDGRISIYDLDLNLVSQLGFSGSGLRGHSLSVDTRGNIYLGSLHGNYNLILLRRIYH